ncbi:hypothetical protein A9179_12445 [Pseudomonas alcaligenes]|uniref:Polysaccharide biosynthesis protein n=2 Tax=Aquipseudomonas alcaligenes TaxID=43263 RepID=A0ABR7S3D3_AQUAC|nr:hypothetical protein [Pseudomonas alcaligenes]
MTLAGKFFLVFFLAKFLLPLEVGVYGLLVATVGYALYWVGLDFYTFTTRELIKLPRSKWGQMLRGQAALSLVLYLLFIPLLLSLFALDVLPWSFVGWFVALLVLEHVNQELMRLLVAIAEPTLAGVTLFLRSGAWAFVVVALMYVYPDLRNLSVVLAAWVLGGGLALLVALMRLRRLGLGGWAERVDWAWVRRGIKVAMPLLLATLALRGIYTLDRYWFEALAGMEALGAYVLFMGVAGAMVSFLDAGVFAFLYPGLIAAFQQGQRAEYRAGLKKLAGQTLLVVVVFSAGTLLAIEPLLQWIGKAVYLERQAMFGWLLLATALYALGMIPHYALYSCGADRAIIYSQVAGLLVFVVATTLCSLFFVQLAVPLGLCAAFLLILLWKSWAFLRFAPDWLR